MQRRGETLETGVVFYAKVFSYVFLVPLLFEKSMVFSPIDMLWGLAKLIGGRASSGHRQIWADGVPVML